MKTHRILGSLLSLVFLMWFLSGFVMIYQGFPKPKKEFYFQQSPSLNSFSKEITIPNNIDKRATLTLATRVNSPVFIQPHAIVGAIQSHRIVAYKEQTLDSVVSSLFPFKLEKKVVINDFDQWIPWKRYEEYFPIHKYYFSDKNHTQIYMSEKTGEIVQETTRSKRNFARFGAIPHWFYFKSLRLQKDLWAEFVIWLSGIGSIMCLSGIVLGLYRSRKWRKAKKRGLLGFSPYKKPWYKWHHVIGLVFGFFVFTFVCSGMMSLMRVPEWLIPGKKEIDYRKAWEETSLDLSTFKLPVNKISEDSRFYEIKEVRWVSIGGFPYYFCYRNYQKPIIVSAKHTECVEEKIFSQNEIKRLFAKKFPKCTYKVNSVDTNDYYYNGAKKHVLRFQLDDRNKTWIYIDARNPKTIVTTNRNTRLRRWLYKGLHSFDFPPFTQNESLRKIMLILLSIFGTIVSLTGVVLSFRFLRRKVRKIVIKH